LNWHARIAPVHRRLPGTNGQRFRVPRFSQAGRRRLSSLEPLQLLDISQGFEHTEAGLQFTAVASEEGPLASHPSYVRVRDRVLAGVYGALS